jgi:hypothetical protein
MSALHCLHDRARYCTLEKVGLPVAICACTPTPRALSAIDITSRQDQSAEGSK